MSVSRGLWLLAVVVSTACSVAIDVDALKNGACPDGMKACGRRCVSRTDPNYGCASDDCRACNFEHGVARCGDGKCQLASCIGGSEDCDHDPANGCEVDKLYDPVNCGQCGHVCVVPSATPACSEGVCAVARCAAGYSDCNRDGSDGCEVHGPCADDAGTVSDSDGG